MDKLTYVKWYEELTEIKEITFRKDNKSFSIALERASGLYVSFHSSDKSISEEDCTFLINKDDFQVWDLFNRLYQKLEKVINDNNRDYLMENGVIINKNVWWPNPDIEKYFKIDKVGDSYLISFGIKLFKFIGDIGYENSMDLASFRRDKEIAVNITESFFEPFLEAFYESMKLEGPLLYFDDNFNKHLIEGEAEKETILKRALKKYEC